MFSGIPMKDFVRMATEQDRADASYMRMKLACRGESIGLFESIALVIRTRLDLENLK